eukprot:Seg1178.11 transcript_id=Seg1178.11/GoldUCD/mRNA.D3Y31 product="Islet cell autoantigen 1" protein_id=Seg1178.11/GoldUCD/D3Y31
MYGEQGHNSGGGYGGYPREDSQGEGYGHNYQSYHRQNDSLKGKIEQKYWKTKQKVIEKFKKDQDEHVVAGDAEVDARLEAYKHINTTCSQLMLATEAFQNRIFALSQDENEMGRFLRDQGSTDKTRAGKMMIAVGKAQSYAAQQRLSLRVPLVRLYQELETFRYRAISDTSVTVERMESHRSDYRAGLLWMAEVSKELDPDVNKRLDKFRDVQAQVKSNRKKFEKLKADVCQKIDLLSASRCNLLSATLAAYQQCMLKFLESTTKSYQSVLEQFKGHPSYQFTILKHIMPNNGVADDEEDDIKPGKRRSREIEKAEEVAENENGAGRSKETTQSSTNDEEDDDKLISFDISAAEDAEDPQQPQQQDQMAYEDERDGYGAQEEAVESSRSQQESDLLGMFEEARNGMAKPQGVYGAFESADSGKEMSAFEDLLGGLDETARNDFQLAASTYTRRRAEETKPAITGNDEGSSNSVDDLLFGSSDAGTAKEAKTDLDLLSDALSSTTFNENAYLSNNQSGFSKEWQDMFGEQPMPGDNTLPEQLASGIETSTEGSMYMPSFLMEQMRQIDPVSAQSGAPAGATAANEIANKDKGKIPPKPKKGQDISAWFNLFSDLDPLANPDAIGKDKDADQERSC